jgi:hypothetical protein
MSERKGNRGIVSATGPDPTAAPMGSDAPAIERDPEVPPESAGHQDDQNGSGSETDTAGIAESAGDTTETEVTDSNPTPAGNASPTNEGDESAELDLDIDADADGPSAFMQALRVGRNARWGVAVGVAVTLVVFVVFVVIPGTGRSSLWYVGLAFVLALSTAGLVATVLTLVRAVRLSRSL